MAWTYSGEPATGSKDAVRFEIQDTEQGSPLLQDEEIEYAITQEAGETPDARGILSAAARCCEVLQRKFAAQADTVIGSLQVTYSKQAAGYEKQAKALRLRAQGLGSPAMPAISRSEKRALREDNDRVQPVFRRGQHRIRYGGGIGYPGGFEE